MQVNKAILFLEIYNAEQLDALFDCVKYDKKNSRLCAP